MPGGSPTSAPHTESTVKVMNEPEAVSSPPTMDIQPTSSLNVLRQLFYPCLKGLDQIGTATDKTGDSARAQSQRLRLWGIGLFEDALPLDELLHASGSSTEPLRTFILGALVDIAVIEEDILRRWESDATRHNQHALENTRMQITAMLGSDEAVGLAEAKWQAMLQERESAGECSDVQYMDRLQKMIELLFDILPAIRGVRHEYVLRVEAGQKAKSPVCETAEKST
ncbi:MAG: hypothetical protein Q9220_006255 [cf. Caloplaca sp. 1 TL-2023]